MAAIKAGPSISSLRLLELTGKASAAEEVFVASDAFGMANSSQTAAKNTSAQKMRTSLTSLQTDATAFYHVFFKISEQLSFSMTNPTPEILPFQRD